MTAVALTDVRVLARWIDDPMESPITIDLRLDAATRRVFGTWSLFGAVNMGAPRCRPFVLNVRGEMDFGESHPTDRYWRCDIRHQGITVGATFSVTWSGGDTGLFRVDKVSELGGKSGAAAESLGD